METTTKRLPDLHIEGAHLIFKNFSGRETEFNKAGVKSCSVVIEDLDTAVSLAHDGWNIKVRPNDKDMRLAIKPYQTFDEKIQFVLDNNIVDDTLLYLQLNIRYDKVSPSIYMIAGANQRAILLKEDEIGRFDHADILNVDLVINPYVWQNTRGSGVTAYVKAMYVTIQQDEFAAKYNIEDCDDFQ